MLRPCDVVRKVSSSPEPSKCRALPPCWNQFVTVSAHISQPSVTAHTFTSHPTWAQRTGRLCKYLTRFNTRFYTALYDFIED